MGWMDSLNAALKSKGKKLSDDEREKICADVVMMSSFGAAAVTYAPVPLSDFVVVTPVQASMVMGIARVYGRELSLEESKHILVELASVCGMSLLAQKGFATLTKLLLPGLGGVFAGPYAFAVTYGMGRVAMHYFRDKERSRDILKQVFEQAVADGKNLFSREKLDEFRKKKGGEVLDFAGRHADKDPEQKRAPAAKSRKKAAPKKPRKKAPART